MDAKTRKKMEDAIINSSKKNGRASTVQQGAQLAVDAIEPIVDRLTRLKAGDDELRDLMLETIITYADVEAEARQRVAKEIVEQEETEEAEQKANTQLKMKAQQLKNILNTQTEGTVLQVVFPNTEGGATIHYNTPAGGYDIIGLSATQVIHHPTEEDQEESTFNYHDANEYGSIVSQLIQSYI